MEIGASGKIDFKPIFDQMYANNVRDWYVEVEQYTNNDPVASCKESFNFLNKANYVKWLFMNLSQKRLLSYK